jgi:hypothetical protein
MATLNSVVVKQALPVPLQAQPALRTSYSMKYDFFNAIGVPKI